jgi:hypothetical protein
MQRRAATLLVGLTAVLSVVAASCTNPSPPGGFNLRFEATEIRNVSFVGDWPTTFWDPDADEEPYLVHLGLRIALTPAVSVTTFVSSTYLNGGAFIGKIGAGGTLPTAPGDGVDFLGVQLPDLFDLANGAPFELLGSVEFLFERDQLIPLGIAQVLQAATGLINAALPPIIANGGLPSDLPGIVTFLGDLLPGVFATIVSVVGAVIGGIAGSDQLIGLSPKIFIGVGGGLASFIGGALPTLISLVNFALSQQNPNPFPNGLPITLGVVGAGATTRYGTAPDTSVYDVDYRWVSI